jgi:RimJ/RimL family protein N-acetyltransferase
MAIDVGSRLVAYTNAYLDDDRKGHAHVHILDPELRRKGLGSVLFIRVVGLYFEQHGLSALSFQTNPANTGINRLLQSFGIRPTLIDDQNPSGMARPGLCNLYELGRDEFDALVHRIGSARE